MMESTGEQPDEFWWAMKRSLLMRHSTGWKNRKAKPLSEVHKFRYQSLNTSPDNDQNHLKIMASMVPDEIIYNLDYSKREFDACLLFGDVSGFTELCEKYNKTGKGGPSRLTQVLNSYIGAMVQEILSHNGDVLKFSGDAFIALFKETGTQALRNRVHDAINCALVIQKSYGTYKTDVDVLIRVKIAVACGHLCFSLIGDTENSHYIMTGQPVMDIKVAENLSHAGEIIMSARVEHHITMNEYLIDYLPDGIHCKVLGVGPNWRNVQRQFEREDIKVEEDVVETNVSDEDSESEDGDESAIKVKQANQESDEFALRPAVNYAARSKTKAELRRFILEPVMRGIDADEPVEYLTEVRQVVILFINCKVSGFIPPKASIDVANKVYLTVCNIVKDNLACVNKISNFDKDLMLLVIFGLRGFKYELESRMALKSAAKCQTALLALSHVDTASAAVTTGKTYCGAFGHALRREYTVIGLVVNKAARLMVAYPNKVTCDRETFLQSKMEAKNFTLQEFVALKGIANPGPIYEFKEVEKSYLMSLYKNFLPLLGREQEIDLFSDLFQNAMKYSKTNSTDNYVSMLLIQGVYRQGKTRLLSELIHVPGPGFHNIMSFTLNIQDYEIPYKTTRFLFSRFFNYDKNLEENRMTLLNSLVNYDPCIRVLNAVFQVNFPVTPEYLSINVDMKYKKLQEIFMELAKKCFKQIWLIVIDDAEYIDDESWLMIELLLDTNMFFFVLSMGIEKELTLLALHVLRHPRIKSIKLKGIDKWYHIGLICQMLRVDGAPAELEKIVQIKSNGNPGWIESFLVTLTQSNSIYTKQMLRAEAYRSGMVIPPLYMVMRLSPEEMEIWMRYIEEGPAFSVNTIQNTRWKMFIESCRESFPDLAVAKQFKDRGEIVNIAMLYEDVNLDDVDPEQAIDVIIVKTFDSLTSYEQLLLKSSSILGDIFLRDMLLYIMSTNSLRLIAVAVKKLFEIRVLCCAKGDFIEGGLIFAERLVNPNEDMSVKCDCRGLIIDDSCADLPKYASCGYLRFRSSEFRQTTYSLLTDNQKREFHERAIRYLERETRRCRSCGTGYFNRLMGTGRIDHTLKVLVRGVKRRGTKKGSLDSSVLKFSENELKYQRTSFFSLESYGSGSMKSKDRSIGKSTKDDIYKSILQDTFGTSESQQLSQDLSYRNLRKLKATHYLTKTFSMSDFSQCTCRLILLTMYSQFIEHAKGANMNDKLFNALIENSYICIEMDNIPRTIKMLNEAMALLDGPMKEEAEMDWMIELKKGKVNTLLGMAKMKFNKKDASMCFKSALKHYGLCYPRTKFYRKIMVFRQKICNKMRLMFQGAGGDKKVDEDYARYHNDVAETLFHISQLYISKEEWEKAELAATWSLTRALITQTDFELTCLAFAQFILISLIQRKSVNFTEIFALRICHQKITFVELEELKAVAFLYYTISLARLGRADLDKFLHIGYMAWRLSTSSKAPHLAFKMLPLLTYVSLIKHQIPEFGNLMQEIIYITDQDLDISFRCWYYALCLQLHIEVGVAILTCSKIIDFLRNDGIEPTIRDPDGKNRLIILIWLWQVRLGNWDIAEIYMDKALRFNIMEKGETIHNVVTGCYLLEGLIIYLVHKMDMKNLQATVNADKRIRNIFRVLSLNKQFYKLICPRLLHLKAYYQIARNYDYPGGLRILNKARAKAEAIGSELEKNWISHSQQCWMGKLMKTDIEFWKEHTEDDVLIDFREIEFVDKFVQYSLPLPLYV